MKKSSGVAFMEGNAWYHRVKLLQPDGTVKYSKRGGFLTASEAEESYRQYEEDFKKSYRSYYISNKGNIEISLTEYLIYWFEEVFTPRVENTTRMVGVYVLYNQILPNIEDNIKLKYVNSDYLNALLKKVSKMCESAGNKSRELLNIALKDAVVQGYIKDNPVSETDTYPRKKPAVNILSKEKLKVLLNAASKREWYLEILLALFCGLRKGEILGLKFSDFNIEESTVSVERQITSNPIIPKGQNKIVNYAVIEKEPKTENSYRTLRVPAVIIKELEKRRNLIIQKKQVAGENYIDLDYISCQDNGLPHTVTSINNALTKICSRNGLPHITVHGLRHMYATILSEQGVPLVKISALLGHSSINTTFEYYCEVMDENERIISFMNNTFAV